MQTVNIHIKVNNQSNYVKSSKGRKNFCAGFYLNKYPRQTYNNTIKNK